MAWAFVAPALVIITVSIIKEINKNNNRNFTRIKQERNVQKLGKTRELRMIGTCVNQELSL